MRTNPEFIKGTAAQTAASLELINDLMAQAEEAGQGVPLQTLTILTATQSLLTEMVRQTAMLNIIARALVAEPEDKVSLVAELFTFNEVI